MSAPRGLTGFDEAEVQSQIAQRVFDTEFKHIKDRLAKQESLSLNIIIGAIVAVVLVVAGIICGTLAFIAQYNQHYLDAEKDFQEEIGSMKMENFKTQQMLNQANDKIDRMSKNMGVY